MADNHSDYEEEVTSLVAKRANFTENLDIDGYIQERHNNHASNKPSKR